MTHIACSLSPSDYRLRIAETADLARSSLRRRSPIAGGERLTFADIAGIRRRLDRIVAAEASCCSFLAFELRSRDGELLLDVTGPPDAQPIIAELFA